MADDNDDSVFTPEALAMIEDAVPLSERFAFLDNVPTVPGRYVDQDEDEWILTENNQWIDPSGHAEPTEYNWMLGVATKFRKVG